MMKGMSGLPMPMVLGHEGTGTVIEVGPGVSRVRPGDRVILSWAPRCGTCWHCVRRESQHCESYVEVTNEQHVMIGSQRVPIMAGIGTFSEVMQVSEMSVVPVRTDLPAAELAMIGCGVTTGVGAALWTAQVTPGARVAVFGCGGVGLSVIQGCRIAGAAQIIAVDPLAEKRKAASIMGATDGVDPTAGDVVEQVRALTDGRGVDYAFEVTGIPDVLLQGFQAIRKRGTVVAVGMSNFDATAAIPIAQLFYEEKTVMGCLYGSAQIEEHFPLLVEFAERGMLNLAEMVSRRIRLDDVNEALAYVSNGKVLRSVITQF
jgi:S-(hydroxymethyl)glutathione dehydrogenase/alcohol dehydrogenase